MVAWQMQFSFRSLTQVMSTLNAFTQYLMLVTERKFALLFYSKWGTLNLQRECNVNDEENTEFIICFGQFKIDHNLLCLLLLTHINYTRLLVLALCTPATLVLSAFLEISVSSPIWPLQVVSSISDTLLFICFI